MKGYSNMRYSTQKTNNEIALSKLVKTPNSDKSKAIRRSIYIKNIIRTIIISNIYKNDKSIKFNIRFNALPIDVKTSMQNNTTILTAYRDVDTGLIVADNTDATDRKQIASVSDSFKDLIVELVHEAFDDKLNELQKLYDNNPTKYSELYKPLDIIASQGHEQLDDKWNIYKQVDSFIAKLDINDDNTKLNSSLAYKNTFITDEYTTFKTAYNNPQTQRITKSDIKLVNDFLSVFLTPHSISVLSWYLGAAICNVSIYDDTISKALIIYSTQSGCGKTTLIDALSRALFSRYGYDIKPDFNSIFAKNNTSIQRGLKNIRLTYYNDVDFCTNDLTDDFTFSNLAINEIKSLISDGYITTANATQDNDITRLNGMHILLTNTNPRIINNYKNLRNQFITIRIKPSPMVEKGRHLGLYTSSEIYKFVENNVQAFANVFAHYYLQNKTRYTNHKHNKSNCISKTNKLANEYNKLSKHDIAVTNEKLSKNIIDGLTYISKKANININLLINNIVNVVYGKSINGIKIKDNYIYIDNRSIFFKRYNALTIRNILMQIKTPIIQQSQKMFKLPIDINDIKQQNPLSKINRFESLNDIGLADDAIEYLKFIAQIQNININNLLTDINKVHNGEIINGIRIVDDILFLNSTTSFFEFYHIPNMRDYLRTNFDPIKKFCCRMFKIGKIK